MLRAIALFSGGLDSLLAVRVLQQQQFEVEALHVRTPFACCRASAAQAAAALRIRLTVCEVGDDYLDLLRRPAHGYGRGMNPCVDCRIYMGRMAARLMRDRGACAVVTGEVLGQRPMSQKRVALGLVERGSGLEGRLLRPLSAQLLPPTLPECQGLVDRRRLFAFSGRGRKAQVELAGQLGIRGIPGVSTGCALSEPSFAPRVRDLLRSTRPAGRRDFELLKIGRHVRVDAQTKVVLGRNAQENAALRTHFHGAAATEAALLAPEGFRGPDALLVGSASEEALRLAVALILRHAPRADAATAQVRVVLPGGSRLLRALPDPRASRLAENELSEIGR
jgi:hypothetical protein